MATRVRKTIGIHWELPDDKNCDNFRMLAPLVPFCPKERAAEEEVTFCGKVGTKQTSILFPNTPTTAAAAAAVLLPSFPDKLGEARN